VSSRAAPACERCWRESPNTALDRGLLLAIADLSVVLGRAQLAFDLHVVAFLQAFRVVGGLAEGDNAMPLGVVHPLAGLLVLVAGLGGERQNSEGPLLFGCDVLGVLTQVAFQSDLVFVECHVSSPLLYLPGLSSGHSCAKRRECAPLPRQELHFPEWDPTHLVGEESGKAEARSPQNRGPGARSVRDG